MDDEKIIALFYKRSEEALTQAADKYGRYCKAVARRILHNQEDVEECVNDAYHAAWNAIPPNKPRKLKIYLARLTRNIACDRYDYNKAKKRNGEFDLILSELEELLGSRQHNVDTQLENMETARLINEFLYRLDREARHIFIHRYWHCHSISSIASQYACSESRIKSILFRTRNKLKAFLRQEGVTI